MPTQDRQQPAREGQLAGKTCIVTGAAHGIGKAVTGLASAEGARVVLFDLDFVAANELATRLVADGRDALAIECDVSDEAAVMRAVAIADSQLGAPTLLVNNAAYLDEQLPLLQTDSAAWDRTFGVTLRGAYLVTRSVLPLMISEGGGSVVNVASVGARVVFESFAAYCSAKAGLVHLTRSVAVDYGSAGVRCNAVLPGAINTREIRRDAPTGEATERRLRTLAEMSVLGRVGDPQEVAEAIVFLLSDRASFITGADLLIDGGWSLR